MFLIQISNTCFITQMKRSVQQAGC